MLGGGSVARTETKTRLEGVQSIQSKGSKAPLFFLHGQWQMPAFFCFQMSSALGNDRPFYGIDPYDLESAPEPPEFGVIAAMHAETIRRVSDAGPLVLGGWCNGALLAYEVACRLQAEGRSVERLVLMDPVYLRYPRRLRRIQGLINGAGRALGVSEATQLRFYLWMRQQLRFARHVSSYMSSGPYRKSTRFLPFEREDYPGVYDWTAMRYVPEHPYRGRTTVLWSVGEPFRSGWLDFERDKNCEVQVLSGTHETCLNDDLPELIEQLRRSLSDCP
jgi:thioesterase domain-containing protein